MSSFWVVGGVVLAIFAAGIWDKLRLKKASSQTGFAESETSSLGRKT